MLSSYLDASNAGWKLGVAKSFSWPSCVHRVKGAPDLLAYLHANSNAAGYAFILSRAASLAVHPCTEYMVHDLLTYGVEIVVLLQRVLLLMKCKQLMAMASLARVQKLQMLQHLMRVLPAFK